MRSDDWTRRFEFICAFEVDPAIKECALFIFLDDDEVLMVLAEPARILGVSWINESSLNQFTGVMTHGTSLMLEFYRDLVHPDADIQYSDFQFQRLLLPNIDLEYATRTFRHYRQAFHGFPEAWRTAPQLCRDYIPRHNYDSWVNHPVIGLKRSLLSISIEDIYYNIR